VTQVPGGHDRPHRQDRPPRVASSQRGSAAVVELIRLAVVVLATVAAFELSATLTALQSMRAESEGWLLAFTVLGAACGYVGGGVFGRFTLGRMDAAERRLREIPAGEMVAATAGGLAGTALAAALTWPVLIFPARALTLPIAAVVWLILVATGVRIGATRGGDLMRFLGASGRLSVTTPSAGARAKLVDTSALIDGRLIDVCRSGFLEGTLVVPRFVLYELQGLADAADDTRRQRGQRGLDVLASLQRSSGVALEVSERDHPEVEAVDAKLVAMALDGQAGLVTVDGNLARVAEVQGVKVLNLHSLAENLRPPVLPGDTLGVRILKPGREHGQGVGYLSDGTMVVVEAARDRQGTQVNAEVTSILSNANGRMVFATIPPEPSEPARLAVHA
jgi:uncharacterized protein YacL